MPATSTTGYTLSTATGIYVKIGRQVQVNGLVRFSAVNGSSNSSVSFTGLPFVPTSSFAQPGTCKEITSTGALYSITIHTGGGFQINSYTGVANGSARVIAINEDMPFSISYST